MGRRISVFGLTAMIAASVWIAPGARAAEADACDLGSPPEGTFVSTGGEGTTVHVGNVIAYPGEVADWVGAYVNCLRAENQRWVDCAAAFLPDETPTVTYDPETMDITIDDGGILDFPAC